MTTLGISVMSGDINSMGLSKQDNKNSSDSKVFDSIINMSINNHSNEYSTEKITDVTVKTGESVDKVNEDKKLETKDPVKETDSVKTQTKEEKVENMDNAKSDNVSKDESDDGKFSETVDEVTHQIKEKLKEILDISDEELEELLSSTGFVAIQLLDSENLKEFVIAFCGESDISSILTNETVLDVYVSLENAISEIPVEDICQMKPEELVQLANETVDLLNSNPEVFMDESTNVVEKYVNENDVDAEKIEVETEANVDVELDAKNVKKTENNKESKLNVEVTKDETKEVDDESEISYESGDNSKESSKDTATTKLSYETFVNNLNNAVNNNESIDFGNAMSSVRTMNQIVEQIVDKIKVNISTDNTTMELMLNPEKLGKLGLSVTAKEGVMTASFIVENEVAKHAIEGQIQILKENLENQGIKVEAVEVTVSNMSDFTRNNDSQSNGSNTNQDSKKRTRTINLDSYFENDASDEEKIAADMLRQNGSTLDIMA